MDNTMEPELASEMVKLLARELKAVRAQLHEAERVSRFCSFPGLKLTIALFQRTSITPCTGDPSNRMTHERAQALIAENDTLKAGNAALQEKLAGLQKGFTHVSSIKSEEDLSNPLQHAEVVMPTAACLPQATNMRLFSQCLMQVENLPDCLLKMKISSAKRCDVFFIMSARLHGLRAQEEASRTREKLSILQEKYKRTKAKAHEYNEARKIRLYYGMYSSCNTATDFEQVSRRSLELYSRTRTGQPGALSRAIH